jgi:hypothetical protein
MATRRIRLPLCARVSSLSLACAILCAVPCFGQAGVPAGLDSKLDTLISEYRLTQVNFVEALFHVAGDFQLPMGIAWVDAPAARTKSDLSWSNLTVRQILESIAQTEPDYEVQVANGVVHVASRAVPAEQNFLLLRLPSFHAQSVMGFVKMNLWRELNSRIVAPNRFIAGDVFTSRNDPQLDLSFTNATVAEIFDSLALASDRKVWVVTFEDSSALTPSGFRRSMQLSSTSPITNEDQPQWDVLYWVAPRVINFGK